MQGDSDSPVAFHRMTPSFEGDVTDARSLKRGMLVGLEDSNLGTSMSKTIDTLELPLLAMAIDRLTTAMGEL